MRLSKLWSPYLMVASAGLLSLSLMGCASPSDALPALQVWSPCNRPLVDVSTDAGVYRALADYDAEVVACNARNGIQTEVQK
jgi:hypothetical protein